jgi:threonine dehydratase
LKREDLQPVHSFKLRGAYNKISQLTEKESESGVIAASAGNHAQGVALASKRLNISALVVMPKTTPSIKVDAVLAYGAQVELYGDSYSDAYEYAMERMEETGRTFIHPFDDPLVIAGQGTVGREITEQLPDVTHIFVPVGGGGLIAGIAQFVKTINPTVKIIGVEPEDSNAMQLSLAAGKAIELPHVGIFADGVAVKQVGDHTFRLCQQYVDEVMTVSTDQICAGIKTIFEDTRGIVEPAGALAVAGATHYKLAEDAKVVAICSGANVTFERLQQIAERTLIGSGKEALFEVTIPEKSGALHAFCTNVVNGHSITELSYRLGKRDQAHIFVGVSIANEKDRHKFTEKMHAQKFDFADLSKDDLAKGHIRHMIGGSAPEARAEYFYEVTFPERPRALTSFLGNIDANVNISLFHYRSTASDTGNVLIGFETEDPNALEHNFKKAGFDFKKVEDSPSLSTFIT